MRRIAHVSDDVNAINRLSPNIENPSADGVYVTRESALGARSRWNLSGRNHMSNNFWTIFVLTWMFGPFVLWVSVLSAVRGYYQIQQSMKRLMDQIHAAHHPVRARHVSH